MLRSSLQQHPKMLLKAFLAEKIQWNYPWTQEVIDLQTGLRKTPYETADPKKSAWRALCPIIGCGRSVQKITRALIVLEHDAMFIRKLNVDLQRETSYDVVSLNDPRGATRKSRPL